MLVKGAYPPPYPNGWYRLVGSDELGTEPKYVSSLGLQIALFRDSKGVAHGIHAYCPHLGANMAVGERAVWRSELRVASACCGTRHVCSTCSAFRVRSCLCVV
jgi:nitrite reductase/ring-hydroxylating ferredoxin subunit